MIDAFGKGGLGRPSQGEVPLEESESRGAAVYSGDGELESSAASRTTNGG